MKKITNQEALAARGALENIIKAHGLEAIRLVWNRRTTEYRLRMKLAREKEKIDGQIAKLNKRFK